jgi:hypothetical protein
MRRVARAPSQQRCGGLCGRKIVSRCCLAGAEEELSRLRLPRVQGQWGIGQDMSCGSNNS